MPFVFAIEMTKERECECRSVVNRGVRVSKWWRVTELVLECRRNRILSKAINTEPTQPPKLLLM